VTRTARDLLPPLPARRVILRLLPLCLCVGLLFTLVFKAVLVLETRSELADLKAAEASRLNTTRHRMEHHFDSVLSDLRLLAHTPSVRYLIAHDTSTNRQDTTKLFRVFAQEKQIYDQVRYLDFNGQEKVRVDLRNGNALVIPPEQLQDKSNRYYFQQSIKLAPDQIYVSPIDLNIERGEIELPYKPMIRFGLALFDAEGARMGILVLNLYGRVLLDEFSTSMDTPQTAMLLNSGGDWLVSPQPEQEWGFMFGHPGGFGTAYANVWRQISRQDSGFVQDKLGLFAYTTIRPLLGASYVTDGAQGGTAAVQGYAWKAVSMTPAQQLPSASLNRNGFTLFCFVGGLLLILLLTLYLASSLSARRRLLQALQQSATRSREITDNLGEGLVVLDQRGRVTEANPEAVRLLGWSREELLGAEAHALFHHHRDENQGPVQICPILGVIRSGQPYSSYDESFLRKDGRHLPVRVNAAPLSSAGGICGSVLSFQDITDVKRSQEEIHRLAFHDALTGLPNRRLLQDRLEHALCIEQRHGRMLGLMFLDLDSFKPINDTYGHECGDLLLKQVAHRLTGLVRRSDTVSRQGGDEFVVLLPDLDSTTDAQAVAQKILDTLRQPFQVGSHRLQIGVSIGIAVYPDSGDNAQTLILNADLAMYAAKQAGRNCYRLSTLGKRSLTQAAHGASAEI